MSSFFAGASGFTMDKVSIYNGNGYGMVYDHERGAAVTEHELLYHNSSDGRCSKPEECIDTDANNRTPRARNANLGSMPDTNTAYSGDRNYNYYSKPRKSYGGLPVPVSRRKSNGPADGKVGPTYSVEGDTVVIRNYSSSTPVKGFHSEEGRGFVGLEEMMKGARRDDPGSSSTSARACNTDVNSFYHDLHMRASSNPRSNVARPFGDLSQEQNGDLDAETEKEENAKVKEAEDGKDEDQKTFWKNIREFICGPAPAS